MQQALTKTRNTAHFPEQNELEQKEIEISLEQRGACSRVVSLRLKED
jgi:hypothetical protein